jgi:hypothetical protein
LRPVNKKRENNPMHSSRPFVGIGVFRIFDFTKSGRRVGQNRGMMASWQRVRSRPSSGRTISTAGRSAVSDFDPGIASVTAYVGSWPVDRPAKRFSLHPL